MLKLKQQQNINTDMLTVLRMQEKKHSTIPENFKLESLAENNVKQGMLTQLYNTEYHVGRVNKNVHYIIL